MPPVFDSCIDIQSCPRWLSMPATKDFPFSIEYKQIGDRISASVDLHFCTRVAVNAQTDVSRFTSRRRGDVDHPSSI
jgi:hypothetical protein